jgi:hypothetical protein
MPNGHPEEFGPAAQDTEALKPRADGFAELGLGDLGPMA